MREGSTKLTNQQHTLLLLHRSRGCTQSSKTNTTCENVMELI